MSQQTASQDQGGIAMPKWKTTLRSSLSISIYLIVVTVISIIGLFKLFPEYDMYNMPEDLVLTADTIQDPNLTIKGVLNPTNIDNNIPDSIQLELTIKRKINGAVVPTATDSSAPPPAPSSVAGSEKVPVFTTKYTSTVGRKDMHNHYILWLIIIVGVLGASIHGLTSVSEYVGNNTFNSNWALWYYLRPFVGGLLALLSFWFLRAGFFSIDTTEDLYGILAVAGLIGLFSKQALYKISDIANTIFTSSHESKLKHKLYENPAPEVNDDPINITVNNPNRKIIVIGGNFSAVTQVMLNKAQIPSTSKSDTQLEVELPAHSIAQEGQLTLKIVNPAPGGGEADKTVNVVPPASGGPTPPTGHLTPTDPEPPVNPVPPADPAPAEPPADPAPPEPPADPAPPQNNNG